jgi:hypothetical protein
MRSPQLDPGMLGVMAAETFLPEEKSVRQHRRSRLVSSLDPLRFIHANPITLNRHLVQERRRFYSNMALQAIRELGMRSRDADAIPKVEHLFVASLAILIPKVFKFVRNRGRSRVECPVRGALLSANPSSCCHDKSA